MVWDASHPSVMQSPCAWVRLAAPLSWVERRGWQTRAQLSLPPASHWCWGSGHAVTVNTQTRACQHHQHPRTRYCRQGWSSSPSSPSRSQPVGGWLMLPESHLRESVRERLPLSKQNVKKSEKKTSTHQLGPLTFNIMSSIQMSVHLKSSEWKIRRWICVRSKWEMCEV